jgi:hypothetical protein
LTSAVVKGFYSNKLRSIWQLHTLLCLLFSEDSRNFTEHHLCHIVDVFEALEEADFDINSTATLLKVIVDTANVIRLYT